MKVTVKCDHSGEREVEMNTTRDLTEAELGSLIRTVMLTCPECSFRAEAFDKRPDSEDQEARA